MSVCAPEDLRAEKRERGRQLRVANRAWVAWVRQSCSCALCGDRFSDLEFHHLRPEEKWFDISRAGSRSRESIRIELRKGVFLCNEHHRPLFHSCYGDKSLSFEHFVLTNGRVSRNRASIRHAPLVKRNNGILLDAANIKLNYLLDNEVSDFYNYA